MDTELTSSYWSAQLCDDIAPTDYATVQGDVSLIELPSDGDRDSLESLFAVYQSVLPRVAE